MAERRPDYLTADDWEKALAAQERRAPAHAHEDDDFEAPGSAIYDDRPPPEEPAGFWQPVEETDRKREPQPVELPLVRVSELNPDNAPARRWHVPDLIPAANVTMLSGDGATGKSLLALQLAVATVLGSDWIGTMPEPGRAVFISAEDEQEELHRRLTAIHRDFAALSELLLIPLAGRDAVMAAPTGRDGLLAETPIFAALKKLIEKHRPSLLVLDTLADIFGGDEIKKVHARQFIGMLRGLALDYGVTIVLLSHPSLSGMQSGTGTSGNTAWNNSVRSRLYFERVRDKEGVEEDTDIRALTTKKANRAAIGSKIIVRYTDGKFVRENADGAGDADKRAERIFLALLTQFEAEGRSVSPNPSSSFAPAIFEKHEKAERIGKKRLQAAMDRLLAAGKIKIEECGAPSRRRQILASVPRFTGSDAGE